MSRPFLLLPFFKCRCYVFCSVPMKQVLNQPHARGGMPERLTEKPVHYRCEIGRQESKPGSLVAVPSVDQPALPYLFPCKTQFYRGECIQREREIFHIQRKHLYAF